MVLYFASDNTTLQEYESHDESGGWSMQKSWSGYSGVGGIGCPYLGDHNETYTAFINSKDEVEIWWKDQSTGTNDTAIWMQSKYRSFVIVSFKVLTIRSGRCDTWGLSRKWLAGSRLPLCANGGYVSPTSIQYHVRQGRYANPRGQDIHSAG